MFQQIYDKDASGIHRTLLFLGEEFRTTVPYPHESASVPTPDDAHDVFWRSFLEGAVPQFPQVSSGAVTIADVFSSVGGLSYGLNFGLRSLGFSVRHAFSVDLDADALQVYKSNFPTSEILNISAADTVDYYIRGSGADAQFDCPPEINVSILEKYRGKVTVLCGGPPCQGHSNLNNKTRRDDPRNQLFLVMPALAVALQVPVVVIENVPTALNDFRSVVDSSISLLQSAGYSVSSKKLLSTNYGGFQTRERLFIIAVKQQRLNICLDDLLRAFEMPARPVSLPISDLVGKSKRAQVGNGLFDSDSALSKDNVDRINYLFDNNLFDLPNSERPICHQGGTSYSSVYGRLSWSQPCGTITTGFNSPGRGRFIHPLERRPITPHEAARIQSFPDSFSFLLPEERCLNRALLAKWIGDAVPPHLAHFVGLYVGAELLCSPSSA